MRRLLTAFLFLSLPILAAADDGLSRMEAFLSPANTASYGVEAEPGTHDAPAVVAQNARGTLVVSQASSDTWTVTGRVERLELSGTPALSAGRGYPRDLWSLEAGGGFHRALGERRQVGASASLGSASDDPFHSIHETELQATGHLMVPSGDRNAWILLLTYSNNRTFANNVPLPGFAYLYRDPPHGLTIAAGFPFIAARWAPTPDWSAHATLFGPSNQSAEIDRRLTGEWQAYAGYAHGARSWFRANREETRDRLFYEESTARLGARGKLTGVLSADVSAGRAFGRRFFEARNVTTPDVAHTRVGDAWIFAAELTARWGGK